MPKISAWIWSVAQQLFFHNIRAALLKRRSDVGKSIVHLIICNFWNNAYELRIMFFVSERLIINNIRSKSISENLF